MRSSAGITTLSLAALLALLLVSPAGAQEPESGLYAPSAWDLQLGSHATELPTEQFIHYACGTNGGPPSLPLAGWTDYARCRPDAATGFYEVYFQYDNELEYWAKAHGLLTQAALYQYTSAYEIPVIVSALFDEAGFMEGLRMVSDPRVPNELREKGGVPLTNFLLARYGDEGWTCNDLPAAPGEQPYLGSHVKRICEKDDAATGIAIKLETHHYRKPGQTAIDPVLNVETQGQFETTTRLEVTLLDGIPDADRRLAEIAARPAAGPSEADLLAARAMNCPGCDLHGANLKRANLANANLAGANLAGANLHEADLSGANLSGATLDNANLNHSLLRRADLEGASVKNAMLYEAHLDGADLSGADLTGGLAGYAFLSGAKLADTVMIDGDLRNSRINDADLIGADLTGTWFDDAQITRADLTDATLSDAVLWRANLSNARLVRTDLSRADLISANLRQADLSGANFSNARLTFVNLSGAKLAGAEFDGAQLPGGFTPPP